MPEALPPGPGWSVPTRPRRLGRLGGALLAGLVLVLPAACSTTTSAFRSHYEAGRFGEAAEAFRADSSLHEEEEALYRVALMHAAEDSPVRSLQAATSTLQRLLELHPNGAYRREARVLLTLLGDVRELSTKLEKMKAVDLEEQTSEPPR